MTLFEQWTDLIENQTKETFNEFWKEYSEAETRIYSDILDHPNQPVEGKLGELAKKYEVRPVIFIGFLDGVNESIEEKNEIRDWDEESDVFLKIVPEALFYNMLKADADYLYGLPQWEDILGKEKMVELAKKYKQSKTVRRESPKTGRNAPCPCGSGKKYKHCCGRNA
ncbi:MAG: SEC-C metal-binding domain-containing protein [Bacillota bacterium]|nr:SEC-C metal-binding domain-containing protein [Bacillota bacterium]